MRGAVPNPEKIGKTEKSEKPDKPEKPEKVKIDKPFPDRGKENLRQALEQTNSAIVDLTARVEALEVILQAPPSTVTSKE